MADLWFNRLAQYLFSEQVREYISDLGFYARLPALSSHGARIKTSMRL